MNKGFFYFVFFLVVVWILLTASLRFDELIVGILVVFILALIVRNLSKVYADIRFSPKSFLSAFLYFFIFLWKLILSNIDVALRVINPSLPIRPGIVEVKTTMKSKIGKLVLANSITLTPGTLTLDVRDNRMFIHWIDVKAQDIDNATAEIVGTFERTLKEIIE